MSEADSILAGINNTRQNAQATAVGAIDDDPDQAARAIELEKATGVNSSAIYGDVEGFEAQHKAALAGEIVKNNPHIADYINSHPLAASVSNGDLGQLDAGEGDWSVHVGLVGGQRSRDVASLPRG